MSRVISTQYALDKLFYENEKNKTDIKGMKEYSTSETVCGKWIDGKPIYRKCFVGTLTTYTDAGNRRQYGQKISENVDKILYCGGCYIDTQANIPYYINSVDVGVDMILRRCSVPIVNTNNDLYIYINTQIGLAITSISLHAYIEYTKTTD